MKEQRRYLVALDLGTTMLKGIAMTVEGTIAAESQAEMCYQYGTHGQVVFDAEPYYQKTAKLIRSIMAKLPANASVYGFSMASASGNTVLCDENWAPICPVISWLDARDSGETFALFSDIPKEAIHQTVGWPLLTSFPIAHLSWHKAHHSDLLAGARYVCSSTDYLYHKLSGRYVADTSTATNEYLQDQTSMTWSPQLINRFDLRYEQLPQIHPSGTVVGPITQKAAQETGLPLGTPIVLGAFDHSCAARGAGVIRPGQMLLSCGTSWVGFYPAYDRRKAIDMNLLVDPFLNPKGPWGAMLSIPAIAHHIDQYVRYYLSDQANRYEVFDALAKQTMGRVPALQIDPTKAFNSDYAHRYSKPEIARGLMEGVALRIKDRMDRLTPVGLEAHSVAMVGGACETPWPQILSNVLKLPVSITNRSYAGAVGAALLAGIGVGVYRDMDDSLTQTTFAHTLLHPQNITAR